MKTKRENNRLIALFMGYTQPHPDYPKTTYWYKKGEPPLTILLYDSSWEWLMTVIEKIEEIGIEDDNAIIKTHRFRVDMPVTMCEIYDHVSNKIVGSGDHGTKKASTYNAVVEFIKWHNAQNS